MYDHFVVDVFILLIKEKSTLVKKLRVFLRLISRVLAYFPKCHYIFSIFPTPPINFERLKKLMSRIVSNLKRRSDNKAQLSHWKEETY